MAQPATGARRPHGTMAAMEGCLACELADGRRPLPGGRIDDTAHWLVDHCVGPLGVGTLVVRPKRHVLPVSDWHGEDGAR